MDYRKIGFGLGLFSVGLGVAELVASRRIARALDAEDHRGVVQAFGARELLAGAALLSGPAHGVRVWNRVVGDGMDLATLGLAARRSPGNRAIWGALAFVAAATAVDVLTALGLDRDTGKTLPMGQDGDSDAGRVPDTIAADDARPTSIEPAHTAQARAPAIS